MELKWFTLARGEPFVRRTQADEYKAARYYQLEAMLASALGALSEDSTDYALRGLQWWAFDPDDTKQPWSGGDSHCATTDVWSKRPNMLSAEEEQEKEAAAKVVRQNHTRRNITEDAYPCSIAECPRSMPGQGFVSRYYLEQHLIAHQNGTQKSARAGTVVRTCFDARCSYEGDGSFVVNQHERQHTTGSWPCGACGLLFWLAIHASQHAEKECKVEGAWETHLSLPARGTTCADARCGLKFKTKPSEIIRYQKHILGHINGRIVCGTCGLRSGNAIKHEGYTDGGECPGKTQLLKNAI
jgi:hypothetical protein